MASPIWQDVCGRVRARAGIPVPAARIEAVGDKPVLVLRRFDRHDGQRIPFLSSMSMLDARDNQTRSYMEIADALRQHGGASKDDIRELWRRIVFNILISNTDDHLRNLGFLYSGPNGWRLSPAYDLNPVPVDVKPRVLTTAINEDDNTASLDLALSVAPYFELEAARALTRALWREPLRRGAMKPRVSACRSKRVNGWRPPSTMSISRPRWRFAGDFQRNDRQKFTGRTRLAHVSLPVMSDSRDPHAGQRVLTRGPRPRDARLAIILVHGRGATAESILALADELKLDEVAYLAPQAAEQTWYPYSFLAPIDRNEPGVSSGIGVIASLIDRLVADGIDVSRIALLGFSQGACLSLEFAARHAQRYAGIFGLSGGLIGPAGTPRDYAGSFDGTPIFLGCSDIDPHIPLERVNESADVFRRMGALVDERIYPGMGHTVIADEIAAVRAVMQATG